MSTTVVVPEQIPGMTCVCIADGGNCSNASTAKYSCEISNSQTVQSEVTQSIAKGVNTTSYSITLLGFILFPVFFVIAVARLIFFLKKSDRLKTTFRVSLILFIIVLILYFGRYGLMFLAPWIF